LGTIALPAAAHSSGSGVGNRVLVKVLDLKSPILDYSHLVFTKVFHDLFLMLRKKERTAATK
jgi:hypothetical protein